MFFIVSFIVTESQDRVEGVLLQGIGWFGGFCNGAALQNHLGRCSVPAIKT